MKRSSLWLLFPFLGAAFFSQFQAERIPFPFPPLRQSLTSDFFLPDAFLLSVGLRRVMADIAWMGLLQTCVPLHHHHQPPPKGEVEAPEKFVHCEQFREKSWRTIKDDPYFQAAYFYSSLFLALEPVFNDPKEATALLEYGLKVDPSNFHLKRYVGIIAFKSKQNLAGALPLLEQATASRDAPALLKALLAKIYEQKGEVAKAKKLWQSILDSSEKNFWGRARDALQALEGNKKQ